MMEIKGTLHNGATIIGALTPPKQMGWSRTNVIDSDLNLIRFSDSSLMQAQVNVYAGVISGELE
jgi:hypothetical protein